MRPPAKWLVSRSDQPRNEKGRGSRQAADERCLQRAAHGQRAGEAPLDIAEGEKRQECRQDRHPETGLRVRREKVWREGDEAPRDVRGSNGQGASESPAARANGTVRPSDIPMTMSRTVLPAVKCFSTWGVCGMSTPVEDPILLDLPGGVVGRSLG